MPLPKINQPIHQLTLPSNGKVVHFRPFTVREEKLLLMAQESGEQKDVINTYKQLINNCCIDPVDVDKLASFDIEYFFIKLRCRSLGEITTPTIICPYSQERIRIELNLDEIEPIFRENIPNEFVLDNSIKIKMKYPTLRYFINSDSEKIKDYYDLIIDCIETIETTDELIVAKDVSRKEIQDFVDVMKKSEFQKLISFIDGMPRIEKKINYTTSDGVDRQILLKGLKDFFQ